MSNSSLVCLLSGILALIIGVGLCITEAGVSILMALAPVIVGSFNLGSSTYKWAAKADSKKDSSHG